MRFVLIIAFLIFLCCRIGTSQTPQPIVFKSLPPPMTHMYELKEIGLIGISNDRDIQFWDIHSKAYFGYVSVIAQDDYYSRIIHVEYISSLNQIAVIFESMNKGTNISDTIYTNHLYLFSLANLKNESNLLIQGNGMAHLIIKKYEHRTSLPDFSKFADAFRYFYNDSTDVLYLMDRKGKVMVYKEGILLRSISTGARNSDFIYPAKNDSTFFVLDRPLNQLHFYNALDGKHKVKPLIPIPTHVKHFSVFDSARFFSFSLFDKDNSLGVLDSVNRLRVFDIKNGALVSSNSIVNNEFIFLSGAFAFDGEFANGVIIVESASPPYNSSAISIDMKTGNINVFTGGSAPFISSVSNADNESKFSMIVSGVNEVEVDLSNLTEHTTSQLFVGKDEAIVRCGNWEYGYYQLIADSNGNEFIKVFRKDSLRSTFMYKHAYLHQPDEQLAGILPAKHWYITCTSIGNYGFLNNLQFHDSIGNIFHQITTRFPMQMLNQPEMKQHIFTRSGDYFMLREIFGKLDALDSCRIRIFSTETFKTLADIYYTEKTDYMSYNRRTAVFAGSNKGFYFISTISNNTITTNYLNFYRFNSDSAVKEYSTALCLDKECNTPARIKHITLNDEGSFVLWFGNVAPDKGKKFDGMQFIVITDTKTGIHHGGLNVPFSPEIRKVLPFRNYFGLVYTNQIDFVQPTPNGINYFLSVIPFVNENTYELSTVYTSLDPKNHQMWYYERSNSDDCISFRYGNSSFRRRQFDIAFNRPDIVLNAVPGHDTSYSRLYSEAVQKRNERIKNNLEKFNPESMPKLTLEKAAYDTSKNYIIQLRVNSIKPVSKFRLRINGNLTEQVAEQKNINAINGLVLVFEFKLILNGGENNIEIYAINSNGIESLPLRITQTHTQINKKPNLHVLVVSVGKYENGLNQLPYALKDGRDVSALFNSFRKDTLFGEINVDTLFDQKVSQESIMQWLKNKQKISVADYVIVFYSGHGLLNKTLQLKLATTRTNPSTADNNTLDYAEVLAALDALPARQKLFLIDACHSGDFDSKNAQKSSINKSKTGKDSIDSRGSELINAPENSANTFETMQNLFSFSEQGNGTVVISASGGMQSAYESAKYKNGYFTYVLKAALGDGKASNDPDGRIWLYQLVKYLKQNVTEISGGKQVPNMRISNPDLNWRVK